MSLAKNKIIVLRWIEEVVSAGKLDLADELVAPNFQLHQPGASKALCGIEGLKREVEDFRAAFPDRQVHIEDIIAEGDKVVVRVMQECTHRGIFQGLAPTDKKVTFRNIVVFRISDGKIAEEWLSSDRLSLLQQLGAIADPARK